MRNRTYQELGTACHTNEASAINKTTFCLLRLCCRRRFLGDACLFLKVHVAICLSEQEIPAFRTHHTVAKLPQEKNSTCKISSLLAS